MNFFIEFVGYPGSGKTHYSKILKKKLLEKKISLIKTDKYFFNYYSSGLINKIIFNNYYNYKRKFKFESNYIFNKQYKYLDKKMFFIIRKFKLRPILNNFKSLLNLTSLNEAGKKRSLNNFKIDLCTYFLNTKKKKYLYNDEGLVQKIYQPYNNEINPNLLEKKIRTYLKSIPLPDIIFVINKKFEKSIKNSKKRKDGFIYSDKSIDKIEFFFKKIDKILKNNFKNKKIFFLVKNQKSLLKFFLSIKDIS
jgi:thymidylate kinase